MSGVALQKGFWVVLLGLALGLCLPAAVLADDLDDGISKATDESISKDDEMGNTDKNINFIKLNAKSQAKVRSKDGTGGVDQNGIKKDSQGGNMNSAVIGPGSNVRGDIIIIDESRGPKTQIVE